MNPGGKSAGGGSKGGKGGSKGAGSEVTAKARACPGWPAWAAAVASYARSRRFGRRPPYLSPSRQAFAIVTRPSHLIHLRKALQTDEGTDRDVTAAFSPFLSYQRNGLDVSLRFTVGSRLTRDEVRSFKALLDKEALLEAGMSLSDKLADVTEQAARLLLMRDAAGCLIGLVHWRFSLQGELLEKMEGEPVLLLCDLWLAPRVQRKGLGTHVLNLLTLAAKSVDMSRLMVAVYSRTSPVVIPFLMKQKGVAYTADAAWTPATDAGLLAYSKPLRAQAAAPVPEKAAGSPDSVLAAPAVLEPPPPVALEQQFASLSVGPPAEVPFWERVAAPAALEEESGSEDGSSSEEEDDAARVLDELCALFEEKHGRLPTAEEVELWKATLSEAASEAAAGMAPLD